MGGFTKLYSCILDSTVWGLSKEGRLLWITMLVKKNREQVVEASVPGLANSARLTILEVESALRELEAPDPYSRSKEYEGRRIEAVDGGWLILNGAKYRDMMSADDRREYQRKWQTEYRKKKREKKAAKFAGKGTPLAGETAAGRLEANGGSREDVERMAEPQSK